MIDMEAERNAWQEQANVNAAEWSKMKVERDAALAEVERLRAVVREADACPHPTNAITWELKEPGGTIAIIDGAVFGTCDLCGTQMRAAYSGA